MDGDEGRTRSLPFFCWCDGGKLKEATLRPHRHMILVSLSQHHFEKNMWGKIHVAQKDRLGEQFRAFHKEPIQSAFHLVNLLGYVSKRKSVCTFSGDKKNAAKKMNHYHVRRSLPRDYKLALVLEWPNGLYQLLDREFYNMEYESLVLSDMVRVGVQWRLPIRSIPGIGRGKRLPLARNWHPCPHPTPHALHLVNGRTVFFQFKDSPPTDFDLCLYDAVQGDLWAPRPAYQTIIKKFRPYVSRNVELEREVETLQAERDQLRAERDQWHTEWDQLRAERDQLRAENEQLRAQINQL